MLLRTGPDYLANASETECEESENTGDESEEGESDSDDEEECGEDSETDAHESESQDNLQSDKTENVRPSEDGYASERNNGRADETPKTAVFKAKCMPQNESEMPEKYHDINNEAKYDKTIQVMEQTEEGLIKENHQPFEGKKEVQQEHFIKRSQEVTEEDVNIDKKMERNTPNHKFNNLTKQAGTQKESDNTKLKGKQDTQENGYFAAGSNIKCDQLCQDLISFRKENEALRKELEQTKDKCNFTEEQLEKHKLEISRLEKENSELKEFRENVPRKTKVGTGQAETTNSAVLIYQLREVKEELKYVTKELEETKSRLSRVMGDRLTDSNPSIADLSDKNRPTKLSERYQELYDNQWTDAFEVVEKNKCNEEETIATLKSILLDVTDFCKAESERQMAQAKKVFLQGKELPKSILKQLKVYRKAVAEEYGQILLEEFLTELGKTDQGKATVASQIPNFVKECFDVCWLMAVQDPPVVLGPEVRPGDSFNKDHFKAYTKIGDTVKFIVWPALHLHENGSVLSKGVAQGQ